MTPAPGCTSLDDIDLTDLDVELSSVYPNGDGGFGGFSIGHAGGSLQVTRIEELSGQRRSAIPPARGIENGRGQMLGGREFVTFPSFDRFGETQAMVDGRATLTLEGGSPIVLATRIVRGNRILDQVAVTVPDVAGRGRVTLDLAFTDDCFRYDATGVFPVDVVPLAETAGCELDEELYWDQLRAVLTDSIVVGGTTPTVGSAFNESKYAPYISPGIDAWIGYMFDKDAPELSLAPGDTIRIEEGKARVDLARQVSVVIWTRQSIARAVTDYPPKDTVEVFEGTSERQPDGSYQFVAPESPGRYVAALSVPFETPCTTGTLWSLVNVEVVQGDATPMDIPAPIH